MMTTGAALDNQAQKPDYSVVRWYALTHLEPDELKARLDQINKAHERDGSGPVYNYFIPYTFIKERGRRDETMADYEAERTDDDIRYNNILRNTLHRFIFIRATGHQVKHLLAEPWNKEERVKLLPYAAPVSNMKYVPDTTMDIFMSACYDQREKFELTPFVEEAGIGAEVILREGEFKSAKARVREIIHRADGIRLTLSVEFFAKTLDLTLYDVTPDKVSMGDEASSFLTASYTDYVERLLLDILSRRVNHKETDASHMADLRTLSLIWRYQPTEVTDRYQQARITALLLICARLRHDIPGQRKLETRAITLLHKFECHTLTQRNALVRAMLHVALYLSTGDPSHRTASKSLVATHAPDSHPLRRFVSLIRR